MLSELLATDPLRLLFVGSSAPSPLLGAVCRVLLAVVLAAVIGCERSSKRHAAGLRTFILVALGTSLCRILDSASASALPVFSAASVIAVAMISGNSILFSSRSQIKGLTTSVGLWTTGILGLCAGAGLYTLTLIIFVLLIGLLSGVPALEIYLKNRSNHFEIHLELTGKTYLQDFVTTLRRLGLVIDDIEANAAYAGSGLSVYTVTLTIKSPELKKYKTHKEIIEVLGTLDYVYHIEEMN